MFLKHALVVPWSMPFELVKGVALACHGRQQIKTSARGSHKISGTLTQSAIRIVFGCRSHPGPGRHLVKEKIGANEGKEDIKRKRAKRDIIRRFPRSEMGGMRAMPSQGLRGK